MKVVFMGTPDFAVGTLQAIIEQGHNVAAVITQPDKAKGRSKELQMPPVKQKALEYKIPVFQPVKVREDSFVDKLEQIHPDVIVVVAFGQILPKRLLEIPSMGCINVHASLLPKYRGAAPIQWAVIDGEQESGVTIMNMDQGLDTGDILKVGKITLDPKETGGSLFDKLAVLGAELLVQTLQELEMGKITPVPQPEGATYAGKLDKALGRIAFEKTAVEIERLIRGLNPWPSAYTKFQGKTLKIWDADIVDQEIEPGIEPGTIYKVDKKTIYVATGQGGIGIKSLQLEGKKRMDTESFLRGYPVTETMILG